MNLKNPRNCDVLVLGSGAGGLATAVTAALKGLDVVLVEKAPQFGGTTAWSGGWMWIPGNPIAREGGVEDSREAARRYLQHELGERFDGARIDMLLDKGPEMVEFFRRNTAVQFIAGLATPDFHDRLPGFGVGRPICAAPFDGRELGPMIEKLRPPLREITVGGMAIAAGNDLKQFMNATRSPAAALHAGRRFAAHFRDTAVHGRGMHLVNGNALVARLLKSAMDAGVKLFADAPARTLIVEDGRVQGAVIDSRDGAVEVRARRGVVLACGGFPHDAARRARMLPSATPQAEHFSAAVPDSTGDGMRMGEEAGGRVRTDLHNPAAWVPVSRVRHGDGREALFPHLIDRARPGLIAVTAAGRRFANEAESYHDFGHAMMETTQAQQHTPLFLVCDHAFLRRYGLGYAKPFPIPLGQYLRSGYLVRGATIEALAQHAGIDPAGLAATVDACNRDARRGEDPAFGRGSTAYNRAGGDPAVKPNPCLRPLERGPFYAVRVMPGTLGTFAGLACDAHARVLDAEGAPIAGLYAVGNDMSSVLEGHYPSGGITLGPAMTFGYIVGSELAARA